MSRESKTANFFLPDFVLEHLDNGVAVRLPIEEGRELFEFLGEQYQFFPQSEWEIVKLTDGSYAYRCMSCRSLYHYMPKYCMDCGAKGLWNRKAFESYPHKD